MLRYERLSDALSRRMESEKQTGTFVRLACDDRLALRREKVQRDGGTIWRPSYVHDVDKILHCPYYNRYSDKTQVFSLIRNDDVTRRGLHVQLVSRIARTIGQALNLNVNLIEAIALGHDIGHPPFAHTGEAYLDELYCEHTGRHFYHNLQSVRVLDAVYPFNLSLQTLSGIAGHNGEVERAQYCPAPMETFEDFDRMLERAAVDPVFAAGIQPSTLEGSVVQISDIIAYLGKDRQDAARVKLLDESAFSDGDIGAYNAEIINNLMVNIIENSYGQPSIRLDQRHFAALQAAKRENYALIYENAATRARLDVTVKPMMRELYGQLLDDLRAGNRRSPVFTHHLGYVARSHYRRRVPYENTEPNQLVVDYLASMTDDYFIDLHRYLFPNSAYRVEYQGYFDGGSHV
ncbi:MAG TPA: HD domain-containing protein [Candidatus Limiplasma stercoravium]|nr:HD domain-containing protein [Candidatus Limiplasma stercoravium]